MIEKQNREIKQLFQLRLETERRDIDANILERYVGHEVIIGLSTKGSVAGTLKDYSRNFVFLGNGIRDMDCSIDYLLDSSLRDYSPTKKLEVIAPEMLISKSVIEVIISWRDFMESYETAKKKGEEEK